MKMTFKKIFWVILLLSKFGISSGQCPTTGLPATTVKGKFDITVGGTKTTTDGVNNTKVTVCPNSNFTVADKSGLSGILYYYNTTRAAFPNPTNGYAGGNPRTIPTGGAGQYIVIQVSYDATTRTIKSYACQAIEIKTPIPRPVFILSSCANLQAQIEIPTHADNSFDSYLINWGDGQTETITKTQIPLPAKKHTYTNTNNKTVTVTGKKTGEQCDATITSAIVPNGKSTFFPNLFSLTVQDNDTIQVRYVVANTNNFDFYQKTGTVNYQNVKKVVTPATGLNVLKLPVKNADKEQYCYKVGVTDACARTSYSDSSCTIPLQVTTLDKRNFLKWKTLTPTRFISYRIVKNGNTGFKNITKSTTDTLTDRPTVCGTSYNYQVIALSGAVQSLSRTITVTGVDSTKPPVITNILSSVEKDKVSITATLPTGQRLKSYTFYRWKNNKLESFNAGGNGNKVIDDKSEPSNQRECYKVAYENGCGIMSDTSAAFCPSFLTLDGSGIKWTDYQKFPLGLNAYYVEKLDDKGAVLTSTKVDKNLKFEPDPNTIDQANPIVKFRIKALSTNNLISYSNDVLYAQKLLMFLPDAFSPNGDSQNEVFEIKGIFIKDFKMRISNRAGNIIFETEDYKQGWDGTFDGETVPSGQYYYEINATDFKGETTKKNGRIMVVR
jgi:gliding motility-associated-like protein